MSGVNQMTVDAAPGDTRHPLILEGLAGLQEPVGTVLGVSDWVGPTQDNKVVQRAGSYSSYRSANSAVRMTAQRGARANRPRPAMSAV